MQISEILCRENAENSRTFCHFDIFPTGVLLPELVVSIILLLTIDAGLMQETGSIPLLAGLLEHLDRFNHLAPGNERDDNEDLAWPGIMGILPLGVSSFADLK